VLLRRDAATQQLPVRAGCAHTGALCRDYAPLMPMRLADSVTLQVSNGRYVAHVPRSDQERLLFISAMYRPEWTATTASGSLKITPVANAFLGVTVPPGVTDIAIAFTPRIQMALTWFSNVVFAGSIAGFIVLSRRRTSSAGSTAQVRQQPA
jgi:uncharacterized membrane protein YfhO